MTGDELDEIDGRVHQKFPGADYSEPFIGNPLGESTSAKYRVQEAFGLI